MLHTKKSPTQPNFLPYQSYTVQTYEQNWSVVKSAPYNIPNIVTF
jgi:hypothetical protein